MSNNPVADGLAEGLLTPTDVAAAMGLSTDALRRRIYRNRGEAPPAIRVGRAWVFRAEDVRKFLAFQALGRAA
jgi:hypothetical protein